MLIPVLIVSSLVHIYSIGYMSSDPHIQRFFSYLSLFTFMMVTLVTANSYLLMFVGLFSAVYEFKFINNYSTVCWKTLISLFRVISRKPSFYTLKDPQRLNVGYSTIFIKNVYRGKVIVQGLLINYYSYLLHLLTIYTYYSYYNSLYYIYYLNLNVYSLFVFKRFYSKIVETNKFSKQYKKEYELTQEQKESIIGIMLADGFLEKGKPTHNARLRIDHPYPEQESYVLSIYNLFASLIDMKPVIIERKSDPRTNKIYKSIYVRTLRFSCLNKYHDLFYRDSKKIIPSNIQDLLTPRGFQSRLFKYMDLFNYVNLKNCNSFKFILLLWESFRKCYYQLESFLFIKNTAIRRLSYKPLRTNKQLTTHSILSTPHVVLSNTSFSQITVTNSLCRYTHNNAAENKLPDSVVPVIIYDNADIYKLKAVKENIKKSGVYRWVNKVNGNCYVGSSINLAKRFKNYYDFNYISKNKMLISKAILKYGYSNFRLEILEYCDSSEAVSREQYYFDLLKPEYNILKIAGSRLGYKHSLDTLAKFKNRSYTLEHRAKLLEHLKSHNSTEEQREKSRKRILEYNKSKGQRVEVFDTLNNKTTFYSSIRVAAQAIGCVHNTIRTAIKAFNETGIVKPIKKQRYIVKIAENNDDK